MKGEENRRCPNQGFVPRMNCGKDFDQSWSTQNQPIEPRQPPPPIYQRKFSVLQRLYKVIVSPTEAMKDIGQEPDYSGPTFLVILETILAAVILSMTFQKIQLTGDSQLVSQVSGIISLTISIAVVIAFFLFLALWLGKSLLVKYFCDSGSGWSFKTAASVTGYAYAADIIISLITFTVVYPLLPTLTLNVSDLTAAKLALANWRAQELWILLSISIPLGLVGITWKSYLGSLGTKIGTHEKTTIATGFAVFLILALLGWGISYLTQGTI